MNLQCTAHLVSSYRSGSQIARILSEEWCGRELYCPACPSNRLSATRANCPAIDFICPNCSQNFQLKSRKTWGGRKVPDAGYNAMLQAIRSDKTPNLLIMQYSSDWFVRNLMLIPRVFFTENVIEKRRPLSTRAQRAGWIGCNILLDRIADDGKIALISAGVPIGEDRVRQEFSRIRALAELPPVQRGWTVEVLGMLRRLGKTEFRLKDVYHFEPELRMAHPRNQNIQAKVRQQMQVLRDLGIVQFVGRGSYSFRY